MRSPGARNIRFILKPAVHFAALLPLGLLVAGFFTGGLGANPVETLTHETGQWGLRILLLGLAITPLARLTSSGWLIQFRRLVGLWCFAYVALHFLIYLLFDLQFDFAFLVEDILDRPYITVGFAAFVILLALAVTSPLALRQRMGRAWQALHRWVYAAGVLAVVHFLWITRVDDREPLIYGAILALLLGYRLWHRLRRRGRQPRRSPGTTPRATTASRG